MSSEFDPYYQWLSIPPQEQPPHYYRLLGVKNFEENPDVLENAADRQMKHLRDCQTGKHAEESQQLLSEVSAARVCLLDREKKAAYDAQLQEEITARKKVEATQERPLAVAAPLPTSTAPAAFSSLETVATARRHRRSQSLTPLLVAGAVVVVLLLVAGATALVLLKKSNAPREVAGANALPTNSSETEASPEANGDQGRGSANVQPPPPVETPVATPTDRQPTEGGEALTSVEEGQPENGTTAPDEQTPTETNEPVSTEEPVLQEESEPVEVTPSKLAVPGKEVRDQKRQQIAAIFPIDEARTFEEKGELAANLIRTARETKDDPPAQFALLNLAREQAAEAGQIQLAFEAIDQLEVIFEFDADNVRVASLDQAAKAAIPPAAKRDVVTLGMQLTERFVARDEFDKATALSERLVAVARPLRDAELIKALAETRRDIEALAADYGKASAAFETLKTSPDDAGANLAAGRYQAFVKQDWPRGLAHLAKGSDKLLAAAARLELVKPQSPDEKLKLADAWWNAAEAEVEKRYQDLARARSGMWYREVVGELSGLDKAKAEKRIQEVGETVSELELSDDELRKLVVAHKWQRTIYNSDGSLANKSEQFLFVFHPDGTVVGTRVSQPRWRSAWKTWKIVDGEIYANSKPIAVVDAAKKEFRREIDGQTHVYRAVGDQR